MVEVNNLTAISIDEELLKKIARKVLKGERIKKGVELSIALVRPGRMKEINKRYRRKNKVTDVLAFPELKTSPFKRVQGLGEIIICPQQVKKNAKRFGSNFKKELIKVLIHGILSLLGYHRKKGKAEEKEQYYLKQLAISD